jgi:DNA-directed RNA polymerase subunit RPC12/RpoP
MNWKSDYQNRRLASIMNISEEKQAWREKIRAATDGSNQRIVQPFPTQRMSYPRWTMRAFLLTPLVALGLNYAFQTYWFWTILCGVIVFGVYEQRMLIRCPHCSRRLHVRTVRLKLGTREEDDHMFYDCPHCKVTWDPHIIAPVPIP